jgi:hypothetical protein
MGTAIASSRTAVRLEPDNIRSIQRAGGGSQAPLQTSGHQAAAGSARLNSAKVVAELLDANTPANDSAQTGKL